MQPSPGVPAPMGGGMPMSGSMQGMDHSRMPGMQGGNMSGMNMQQMMAHCAQMRAEARPGAPMTAEVQSMMAHCNQMGGSPTRPTR